MSKAHVVSINKPDLSAITSLEEKLLQKIVTISQLGCLFLVFQVLVIFSCGLF